MKPKKKLPRYKLKIDPASGAKVSAIALVEQPAIESNFMWFGKDKEYIQQDFSVNDERQELLGIAMAAGQWIYRKDNIRGEFEVAFDADQIRDILIQFAMDGFLNHTNIEHNSMFPAGATIFQAYVTDKKRGVHPPKGYESASDGSLVIGMKVHDPETWAKVKSGEVKGFSIEGLFQYVDSKFSLIENNNIAEDDEYIISLFTDCISQNKIIMTQEQKELIAVKLGYQKQYLKLSIEGKTYSDSQLKISDKSVGGKVEAIGTDGSLSPVEDGSYTMDNGFTFAVKDGLITSIEGQEAQAAEVPASGDTAVSAATPTDAAVSGDTATEGSPAEKAAETPTDEANEDGDIENRVSQLEDLVNQLIEALQMSKAKENSLSAELAKTSTRLSKATAEVTALTEGFGALAQKAVHASKTNITFKANEDLAVKEKNDKIMESYNLLRGTK